MKKILVTGSEGYIGQHLVELLISSGHHVTGCDLCWYDEAFVTSRQKGYNLIRRDFSEIESNELRKFDVVCHLAAISNDPMGDLDPEVTLSVNKDKTISFAESCASAGVDRFLFSSSCSVYGEAVSDLVDENSELNPVSLYAETKVAVEKALSEIGTKGFIASSLRNATAFGHSANLRLDLVINDFVATALTTGSIHMLSNGEAHRPLVHCRDIASAFVTLSEATDSLVDGLIINFGATDANHRVIDMARKTQAEMEECGLDVGTNATKDTRDYAVDFSKFANLFPNFRFEYSLNRGICALRDSLKSFNFSDEDRLGSRFKRLALLQKALEI